MGLSFHEMQAAAQEMSLRAVFDEDLSNYTLCDDGRYEVYTEYTDDAVSEVDKHKNITVNDEQCNLTQEENSQYVPFKLPRYWDGVDLMTKLIQFHYVNINGGSGVSTAVNVRFNDSYIICGWLINKSVTAVAGDVTFEITATGTNEKSADYRWRTRPNGKFTVLEALSYDGIIEPSDDWYAGFVKSMQEYTTKAAESAKSARDYADQSKSNLDQVTQITETFATNAQEVKETAINEINNAKVSGVNAVEAAAAEIVNDREKITENANNISSLKGDIADIDYIVFKDKIDELTFNSEGSSSDITLNGNTITSINATKEQYKAFINTSLFENGKKYIVVIKFKNNSSTDIAVYANAFSYSFKASIGNAQSLGIGKSETSVMSYTATSDIRGFSIYSLTENASYEADIYVYEVTDKDTSNIDFSVGGAKIKILKSDLEKPYFGKILCTYGDSITAQQTWQDYVQRELGFSKYYNHGVGGRRLMAMATDECLAEITEDFDVILVMGGQMIGHKIEQ